jgi:hypothetical protein
MSPLYSLIHRLLNVFGVPSLAPRYACSCNIHWANFR